MTVSFAQMFGEPLADSTEVSPSCGSTGCDPVPPKPVGEVSQDDADREERIRHHRECMEAAMREYEKTGCFSARGQADYHRIQFEREIKARSPQQIAHMEAQKGLR